MNVRKIFELHGIEADKIDLLTDAINREVGDNFVSKKQYSKKIEQLTDVTDKYNELEATQGASKDNEYESKYNSLVEEFEGFKSNLEAEKVTQTKANKVRTILKDNGYTRDKILDIIARDIDYSTIEITEEGISGFNIEKIDSDYGDFKERQVTTGSNPITPPSTTNVESDPFLQGFED